MGPIRNDRTVVTARLFDGVSRVCGLAGNGKPLLRPLPSADRGHIRPATLAGPQTFDVSRWGHCWRCFSNPCRCPRPDLEEAAWELLASYRRASAKAAVVQRRLTALVGETGRVLAGQELS